MTALEDEVREADEVKAGLPVDVDPNTRCCATSRLSCVLSIPGVIPSRPEKFFKS